MKNKKRKLLIISLVISSILMLIVPVAAKYITEHFSNVTIESDKFYFTIDLLGDTNTIESLEKTYYFYGGDTKEVTFNIQNFFDDFRVTNSNIKYNISLDVTLPSGSSYETSKVSIDNLGENVLPKSGKNSDTTTLTILEGYDNETIVKVTVSSTSPYKKTFVLTFVLMTYESEASYYIIDSKDSLYAELIFTTNVIVPKASLIIDFNSINALSNIIQVDMTNIYVIDEEGLLNQLDDDEDYLKVIYNTLTINSGEAISIKFFKSDITKDYSVSNTKLTSEVLLDSNVFTIVLEDSE